MEEIRAVVLGASGYGGAELLRLAAEHPKLRVVAAGASSRAGEPIAGLYPGLTAFRDWTFVSIEEALDCEADIVFSSLPTGESRALLAKDDRRLVDLSADFRLEERWVYGLPERSREAIASATRVANPGCYPTASLISLLPLAEAGMVGELVHISATSGVSGAGRAGGEAMAFTALQENVRPYKVTGHGHIAETEAQLSAFAGSPVSVTFVPMVVPAVRGILSVAAVRLSEPPEEDLTELYRKRYADHPFVRVVEPDALPEPVNVRMTNMVEVSVRYDERTSTALCIAALDNLVKGAAGQAMQNANLMFGFPETAGLELQGGIQ